MANDFFQFLSGKKSFGLIQKLSEKVDLTSLETWISNFTTTVKALLYTSQSYSTQAFLGLVPTTRMIPLSDITFKLHELQQ